MTVHKAFKAAGSGISMRGTKSSGGSGEDEDPGARGSGGGSLQQTGLELGLQAWPRPLGLRHILGRGVMEEQRPGDAEGRRDVVWRRG